VLLHPLLVGRLEGAIFDRSRKRFRSSSRDTIKGRYEMLESFVHRMLHIPFRLSPSEIGLYNCVRKGIRLVCKRPVGNDLSPRFDGICQGLH
jgi:hypothetical protein